MKANINKALQMAKPMISLNLVIGVGLLIFLPGNIGKVNF